MPTPPDHQYDAETPPLPTDALAPMFGLARRAQAAIADATLANLKDVLSSAQEAVETARTATREVSEKSSVQADQSGQFAPALKTIAERNMKAFEEMTGLAQKCTRAYLDLPAQLASCRSPQDVLGLQMRLWQGTMNEYAESSRRVMNALAGQQTTHVPTVGEILASRANGATSPDRSSALREASQAVAAAEAQMDGKSDGKRGPDGRRAA